MQGRFASTAKYWGDTAVVYRATEGRTGPVAEQQFGQFKTWTQAHYFASRLSIRGESQLPVSDLEAISEGLIRPRGALEESIPNTEEMSLCSGQVRRMPRNEEDRAA